MASRKQSTSPTPPSTSIPARTGDPNQPDGQIGFDIQVPGAGEGGQQQAAQTFQDFNQKKFDEAFGLLRNMTLAYRLNVLRTLRRKGFGQEDEVSSTGLEATDVDRFKELLVYQYVNGKPLTGVINNDLSKIFPDIRPDGVPGARRTPAQDVDRVFGDVMRVKIGRGPTAQEKERFRSAYSAMESGDNAPTIQSAAEEQIMAKNTAEVRQNRFVGYMNAFEQMLRSA